MTDTSKIAIQCIKAAVERDDAIATCDRYRLALEKISAHAWSPKDRRPTLNRHAREMWQTAVDALDGPTGKD